jgi:hypothetical protein
VGRNTTASSSFVFFPATTKLLTVTAEVYRVKVFLFLTLKLNNTHHYQQNVSLPPICCRLLCHAFFKLVVVDRAIIINIIVLIA